MSLDTASSNPSPPPAAGATHRRGEEPSEFRSYVLSVMPNLCGVIPPLAGIVSEYVEGEKYPVYHPLSDHYQPNSQTIFEACCTSNIEQLRYLVEKENIDPDTRSRTDFLYSRPLIVAAAFNSLPSVQYLLFRGVSPFTRSNQGMTALQVAATLGHQLIADYFLTFFNSPAIAAQLQANPPSGGQRQGEHDALPTAHVHRLSAVTDNQGATVLHSAAAKGCRPLIERLIRECDLDPNNSANTFKETPLHAAAGWGKMDAVRMLVEEFHVDVRKVNSDGRTAAELAENEGFMDVAAYLKEKEEAAAVN